MGKTFSKSMYFLTNLTYALFYKINIDKFNKFSPFDNIKLMFYAVYYLLNPKIAKHFRKSHTLTPNMGIIER